MKMRRLCAYIMALLLAVSMPLSAMAAEYDLVNGSIEINAPAEGDQTVSQGGGEGVSDSAPVITQSGGGSTSNTVTIKADAGSTANVTLDGVNINSDGAAIQTSGGGNVTIELDGENTVKSGEYHAGVEKQNSGNLTITDDNETAGSLEATGGKGGAGIGGKHESDASNITISGGTVKATGGEGGAGIGGGDAKGSGSNITISDGTVNANGGEGGAGIGGGASGAGSGITIKGGTVDANGGTDAAGIGGGTHGNGSNITISGGTVNATGGNPPIIGSGDALEFGEGGGAGIGGGAYGEGNNITVKFNAQVTAEGKGNAANIGNGTSEKATEQQKDKVDLSGLSSFGNVNGVSGSDGGYHASNGSSSSGGSTGGSTGGGNGNLKTVASHKTWTDVAADLGKITASDNNGNALGTVVWLNEEDTLKVTAPANNVLVTGNKADLLQLKEDGVKKINLQTNRVNVSVTNELLQKITGTGGFQLAADDTTVSLSSTDGNNQKAPGLTLTANRQPEKGKLQVDFRSEESKEGAGDVRESLNKTLQVSTNAPEATLSYDQKYLQTLLANSELGSLALAVGNVIATMETQLAAITAQNGSGSISIGDNTVNMNGIQISANNSSGNSQLSQRIDEIMFQLRNPSQSGSAMNVTVTENSPVESVSLTVSKDNLQSLMDQGVEKTTLTVGDSTTGFKNSDVLKKLDDSRLDSAMVYHKHSANGEVDAGVGMFGEGANQLPFTPFKHFFLD